VPAPARARGRRERGGGAGGAAAPGGRGRGHHPRSRLRVCRQDGAPVGGVRAPRPQWRRWRPRYSQAPHPRPARCVPRGWWAPGRPPGAPQCTPGPPTPVCGYPGGSRPGGHLPVLRGLAGGGGRAAGGRPGQWQRGRHAAAVGRGGPTAGVGHPVSPPGPGHAGDAPGGCAWPVPAPGGPADPPRRHQARGATFFGGWVSPRHLCTLAAFSPHPVQYPPSPLFLPAAGSLRLDLA
jgi:hypothetical protein